MITNNGHVFVPLQLGGPDFICQHCHLLETLQGALSSAITPCYQAPGFIAAPTLPPDPVTPTLSLPFATSETFFGNEPPPPVPEKARCFTCTRELSKTLDAYYGRDPVKALQCANCRDGRAYT